jgi:hypothetical protein
LQKAPKLTLGLQIPPGPYHVPLYFPFLTFSKLHLHPLKKKKPPNSLEPKNPSDAPSAPPLPPYPATSHTRHCPIGLYPLQLIPGEDRAHVPFRVSELKEIKKDLGNYTENPDQYIQAFREVSQNFELSWKDVILLLSQTLTALEKQCVLDQVVKVKVTIITLINVAL